MGALGKSLDLAQKGWNMGRIPITAEQPKELRRTGGDKIEKQNLLSNNLGDLFPKENAKSSETKSSEIDMTDISGKKDPGKIEEVSKESDPKNIKKALQEKGLVVGKNPTAPLTKPKDDSQNKSKMVNTL
jgi:hypothetical protein